MKQAGLEFLEDLGRLALFADLPAPELEKIAASAEEVSFGEGEWIIRQGDPQSAVYVIVEGEVAVVIDDEDRRVLRRAASSARSPSCSRSRPGLDHHAALR